MKKSVLILCTGNSCRSQMAEGFLRHFCGNRFDVYSAGSVPSRVNPVAVQVMQEAGVDISGHRSKHVDEFKGVPMDYVITVCDNARSSCPVYLGAAKKFHWPFPDPPHDREFSPDVLREFRRVRDLIRERFSRLAEVGDPALLP